MTKYKIIYSNGMFQKKTQIIENNSIFASSKKGYKT